MISTIPVGKIDPSTPGYAKAHKQATDFEGVFLNTLMKEMFASVKSTGEDGGGSFGEDTWRSMQSEQFANSMAQQGGIGLADQLMPSLLALQEAAPAKTGV